MARKGISMLDGSHAIRNADELRTAIRSAEYGRRQGQSSAAPLHQTGAVARAHEFDPGELARRRNTQVNLRQGDSHGNSR